MSKRDEEIRDRLAKELEVILSLMPTAPVAEIADLLAGSILKAIHESNSAGDRGAQSSRKTAARPPAATTNVWLEYSDAYEQRYGVAPIRNAQVNGMLANLVANVGEHAAIGLVKYYVAQNDQWYVQQMHGLKYLIGDWQKLLTRMQTGRVVSRDQARKLEQGSATQSAIEQYLKKETDHG